MLRPVEAADRENIHKIVSVAGNFSPAEVRLAMELVDDVITKESRSEYRIHVLEEQGQVIGYVCYGLMPLTEAAYALCWMAVDPEFQRQGYEKWLIRFIDEEVQRLGGRLLSIEISSLHGKNTAMIYQRNGYRLVARIKDFYREGDDKLIFIKEFSVTSCHAK